MQSTYILSRKIQKLSNTITQRRNRDLKKLGLTAEQADALLFFHAHPESAPEDFVFFIIILYISFVKQKFGNSKLLFTLISSANFVILYV